MSSGDLITRNYSDFLGVDFSNYNVSLYRSPDSVNMWKDYKKLAKGISSRPGLTQFLELSAKVYGMFFFKVGIIQHIIIHAGTSLYDYNMNTEELNTIKTTGMNPHKSQSFIYNNILYIKDGINYLQYNGTSVTDVVGYIPTTSISRKPIGGGTDYNKVNLLSDYRRNSFVGDGISKDYYLDVESFNVGTVSVTVNGSVVSNFTEHPNEGYITFGNAPSMPDTDGQDNVIITFAKQVPGNANIIKNCTLLEVFDNRIFFSGNVDYPNSVFWSALDNPTYVRDTDYTREGLDATQVKAMVTGSNALWVMKEPSQSNTSIYYHTPSIDQTEGATYPSSHSNISTGCISTAINFNDDVVLFSDFGLEGISGEIDKEQFLAHRSSLVDSKMLVETKYKEPVLVEWQGYLLIFMGTHCYLADSRGKWTNADHLEYEWFYWEMEEEISYAAVLGDKLYLCSENGIYTLDGEENINSYWTTARDTFENPNMQKITNKKGCILNADGNVTVSVKVDDGQDQQIGEYTNMSTYVVPRIKKKKWKNIQFKFSSSTPINIYSFVIQSYVGSYVKR